MVVAAIRDAQTLAEGVGTESGPREGWRDLESLLWLARSEVRRVIEHEKAPRVGVEA